MKVCPQCKEQSADSVPDGSRPFPAFTVAGALLGVLGAAVTGAFLLVPAVLIPGALADVGRCEVCGRKLRAEEGLYQLLDAGTDPRGRQVYRPARKLPGPAGVLQEPTAPRPFPPPPIAEEPASPQPREPWSPTPPAIEDQPVAFVYDLATGQLVAQESATTDEIGSAPAAATAPGEVSLAVDGNDAFGTAEGGGADASAAFGDAGGGGDSGEGGGAAGAGGDTSADGAD